MSAAARQHERAVWAVRKLARRGARLSSGYVYPSALWELRGPWGGVMHLSQAGREWVCYVADDRPPQQITEWYERAGLEMCRPRTRAELVETIKQAWELRER